MSRSSRTMPLSHGRLAVLLAVAHQPATGAAIYDQVIGDSIGDISIKTSTLYDYLHELERDGYLTGGPTYRLADRGWQTLENERHRVKRYGQLLAQRLAPHLHK